MFENSIDIGEGLAVGGGEGRLGLGGVEDGVVHGGHAPAALGFLAHGHAAAVEFAARGLDGELVLVPDRFADGMEGTLLDFEMRGRGLVEIFFAEVADDLIAAVERRALAEQNDFRVEAIAEGGFVGCVEGFGAAVHFVLHGFGEFGGVQFIECGDMEGLLF